MQASTIKKAFLTVVIASMLPLAACGDNDDTPTSPTQPGPPVSTPAPSPGPGPSPAPPPTPQPPSVDPPATSTVSGVISNFSRPTDDSARFRIDDFTIVEAGPGTTVRDGSSDTNVTALRLGQAVTVTGTRNNGTLTASHIVIDSR